MVFLSDRRRGHGSEEAKDAQRSIPAAYIAGIVTLIALALGVMVFAGGVGDWKQLANINDPLPQAMKLVVGGSSGWLHMLVWLGLFGWSLPSTALSSGIHDRCLHKHASVTYLRSWRGCTHASPRLTGRY
jgi:ethanolamine permease